MIRYTTTRQMSIEEFQTPFQINLDKNNRWVKLSQLIPWDEFARIYYSGMSDAHGAPAIDARIVIGAMIVKHKLKLDDREAIEYIRENVYVQFFLGLSDYTYEDVFDRSLFTTLRYRMGTEKFDRMNSLIIEKAESIENLRQQGPKHKVKKDTDRNDTSSRKKEEVSGQGQTPSEAEINNKGKLQLDATVADQMIVFPTDLGLLNTSREESERLIDELHKIIASKKKPRTYRKRARKQYLQIAKKKSKTKKEIRKGIGQQLKYLKRNIGSIYKQLDELEKKHRQISWPLSKRDQKIFWVIQHIYTQQQEMHQNKEHSIADRIVNIYQPHVRPIVRGKEKAKVEFGGKLGMSLNNGFARINTFSWDAYNESTDLKKQVDDYKTIHGYYPEAVLADTIYGNRENRAFLKEHNIRFVGKALGRPPQILLTYYQRRKQQKERNERNHIEGKFGQGKNGYNLSKIRARQQKTSESWVSCIFFVMNLLKLFQIAGKTGKDFVFVSFLLPLYLLSIDQICRFKKLFHFINQEKFQYKLSSIFFE
jgi:transposase, IS5 family